MQKYLDTLGLIMKRILLHETVKVYLDNQHYVEYPKIFMYLRGHDLEEIIYKEIVGRKILKEVITHFTKPESIELFIPFELQKKFENLTKVFIEINENNFEKIVFNSCFHWFVKFVDTSQADLQDSIFSNA